MAVAVEVRPLFAGDALEIEPSRAAQVAGVGHQLFALQISGKDLLAKGDGLVLVGLV